MTDRTELYHDITAWLENQTESIEEGLLQHIHNKYDEDMRDRVKIMITGMNMVEIHLEGKITAEDWEKMGS